MYCARSPRGCASVAKHECAGKNDCRGLSGCKPGALTMEPVTKPMTEPVMAVVSMPVISTPVVGIVAVAAPRGAPQAMFVSLDDGRRIPICVFYRLFQGPNDGDLPTHGVSRGIEYTAFPDQKASSGLTLGLGPARTVELESTYGDPRFSVFVLHCEDSAAPTDGLVLMDVDVIAHLTQLQVTGWYLANSGRGGVTQPASNRPRVNTIPVNGFIVFTSRLSFPLR